MYFLCIKYIISLPPYSLHYMDQSYNNIGVIETDLPDFNEFWNFTPKRIQSILDQTHTFWESKVQSIMSYEAFWYPENKDWNKDVTFNNFVFNFFLWGSFTDSDVEITDELIARLDGHWREYRERYLKRIRSFQEFKIVFPELFQAIEEMVEQNWYRNIMRNDLDDETRRYIYSAYCWMRTYPWITDYALFA